MKKIPFILGFILLMLSITHVAQAQCATLLTEDYISDGQYYSTKINNDEVKDCQITLIDGNEYRLIACSEKGQKIRMEIFDKEGHVLFDNKNHNYVKYWNFRMNSSVICTIKLSLADNTAKPDEIVLLVGFKK